MLQKNINKIHTTVLGEERISRNLNMATNENIINWCKNAISNADLCMLLNKNWYVYFHGNVITINATSYTIITAHKIDAKIREINTNDYCVLKEFLNQAIFVPKNQCLPTRDILNLPELSIYIENFGKQDGDLGVVAEQNGQIIGAAWTRIISAYGNIDKITPELAISILPEFRGYGIGTKLMKKLFIVLKNNGYQKTSLSVQKGNPALRFYKKLGYKIIVDKKEEAIMVKEL